MKSKNIGKKIDEKKGVSSCCGEEPADQNPHPDSEGQPDKKDTGKEPLKKDLPDDIAAINADILADINDFGISEADDLKTPGSNSDFSEKMEILSGKRMTEKDEYEKKDALSKALSDFKYIIQSNGNIVITGLANDYIIEAIIPEGVVSIADDALKNSELVTVNLPESIIKIGDRAFVGCKDLSSINFPGKLMMIGDEAFADCSSLDIEFPKTIKNIGKDALKGTVAYNREIKEREERKRKEEEEKKRKEEEERRRKEEEDRKRKEEEERKRKAEEERRRKEEAERMAKEAEELRLKEEQDRKRKEEEDRRRKAEEERRRKEEAERMAKEAEQRRLKEEQDRKRKEEEDRKRKTEEERRRKEEAERMAREAEERRRKEEAERIVREAEQRRRKAEEERMAKEAEQRRQKEEEQRMIREAEERRLKEEEDRRRKEEEHKYGYSIGATTELGNYHGATEWIVLAKDAHGTLIISKDIIDYRSYNDVKIKTTWKGCTLRKWLNREYLNEAFTKEEKDRILMSHVVIKSGPLNIIHTHTDDKVFLLSVGEAEEYFSSKIERKTEGTKYANGIWSHDQSISYSNAFGEEKRKSEDVQKRWWLRSSVGLYPDHVDQEGYIKYNSSFYCRNCFGVRPAMWIKNP